jgi:Gas vesicle protein K
MARCRGRQEGQDIERVVEVDLDLAAIGLRHRHLVTVAGVVGRDVARRASAGGLDRGSLRPVRRLSGERLLVLLVRGAARRGHVPQRGLAQLVLLLVEILGELLERQAVRLMAAGSLSDEETEKLGAAFLALHKRVDELYDELVGEPAEQPMLSALR